MFAILMAAAENLDLSRLAESSASLVMRLDTGVLRFGVSVFWAS